jgi:membrane associated rhomboid family serine protease
VENKLGSKFFILTFFICSIFGNLAITYNYYEIKNNVEKSIKDVDLKIKDIKITNFFVDDSYINSLNSEQSKVVSNYNHVISKAYGSSSALFGIIFIYLFYNIKNIKKILLNFLCVYLIFNTIFSGITNDIFSCGSDYAHISGVIGGIFMLIYLKLKKDVI